MILINNVTAPPEYGREHLLRGAAKKLGIPPEKINEIRIVRRSIDARRKQDVHYLFTLAVSIRGDEKALLRRTGFPKYSHPWYEVPKCAAPGKRPVVVGFGPAGMFASLVLAEAGLCPVVLERGEDVDARASRVAAMRSRGILDPESNVQFGEGGAGTFSDGKLNTGVNDERIAFILQRFHEYGAPESVTYDAKPHVGTDLLPGIVKNLRKRVISLGGEVRFGCRMEEILQEDGKLTGLLVHTPQGMEQLDADHVILACGHSARDTFEMLEKNGYPLEPKSFSMGARIEHSQKSINIAQYGEMFACRMPAAPYKLNVRFPDGESAYTFCMCPGGEVSAAASEEGRVVTNGMSCSARDGANANSALLVTLTPADFPYEGALGGMKWQREIEEKAFAYGGKNYFAPAQKVGDFLRNIPSSGPGSIQPSYLPGVKWGSLDEVLPEKITGTMRRAIPELAKKLQGFDDPDAVLTCPETRSSSPVRILRNETLQCRTLSGLYPCGEGAGYAGGIVSAAVDGMKCAEAMIRDIMKSELNTEK